MLPSKDSTEFKRIKVFVPLPEHVSDSGKFKGVPEIKKEIETEEKYLPSKVKKFGLNPNAPKIKRKDKVRWKVRCGCVLSLGLCMHSRQFKITESIT